MSGRIPRSASPGLAARAAKLAASTASNAPSKPPDVLVPGDGSSTGSPLHAEPPPSLDPFSPERGISLSPPTGGSSSSATGLKQRHSSLQVLQRSFTASSAKSAQVGSYAQVGSDAPENPLEV